MQELNLAGTFRPWRMLLTTLPPTRMARKGLSQLFYKDIFYEAIYFISSCSFLLCKFPTVQIEMFQFSPPDSLYRLEKQSRPLIKCLMLPTSHQLPLAIVKVPSIWGKVIRSLLHGKVNGIQYSELGRQTGRTSFIIDLAPTAQASTREKGLGMALSLGCIYGPLPGCGHQGSNTGFRLCTVTKIPKTRLELS